MDNWNIGCGAIPQFRTKGMELPIIICIFYNYTLGIQGTMTFGDAKKEYDAGTSTRVWCYALGLVSREGGSFNPGISNSGWNLLGLVES